MATSAALTLKDPIIPLICSFDTSQLRTTKVENEWTVGTGTRAKDKYTKMYLPVCDDPSNKELFLYVVDAFIDAAAAERLHLTTGNELYNKFRQVVGGALRIAWVVISDARANKDVDTFMEDLMSLIGKYLAPSAFEDQLAYLRSTEKPYSLDCEALGARLEVISRLGRLLPGAPEVNGQRRHLFPDESALKRAYFAMVRGDWKVKFVSSAHDLDDVNFSYQRLVRFMSTQETISKQGHKRPRQGGGYHHGGGRGGRYGRGGGGRGYGRGGFGGGHSNYWGYSSSHGGGRGRGNSGNYQYRGPSYGGRHYQSSYSPGGSPGYAQGFRTPTQGSSTPTYGRGRGSSNGRGGSSYGRGTGGRGNTYGRGASFTPGGRQIVYPGVAPTGPRPPQMPNFMADNYHQEHYHQEPVDSAPADNYYQEQPVEDQYYDGEPVEHPHSNEHYYQEGQPEEHYMADDQGNNGDDTYSEEHYFQDFGF